MEKLYLRPKEVEALYGIKANTLAVWRSQGVGPDYYKAGKTVLYKKEEVDKFFEAKRVRCFRPGE